jgi:hypothetical protein
MKMKYNEIVQKVNTILGQYEYPLTLRQVYYRLVAAEVIANTRSNYTSLSSILVKARERAEVDYRRIEDRVRNTIEDRYALADPGELQELLSGVLDYAANNYKRDPWLAQDNHLEVWLEKDALSTVISRVATDVYHIPVAVNRGYGSFSFIKEGTKRLSQFVDKSIHILYFGDLDPSGEDMVRDLQRRLKLYGAPTAIVHKVALTPTQVTKWQLPPAPVKRSDKRAAKFIESHGDISAVELDALDPENLQAIVKDAIEYYIDPRRWQEAVDKSTADKEKIVAAIGNVKGYLSDALA